MLSNMVYKKLLELNINYNVAGHHGFDIMQ